MSRKRTSDSRSTGATGTPVAQRNVPWGGFVEIRLSETDRAEFDRWWAEMSRDFLLDVREALASGVKLGISYDRAGDFYLATFTANGIDTIGLQDRWCLTARAPEVEQAIGLLCFKHFHMAQGDWGQYKTNVLKGERFG